MHTASGRGRMSQGHSEPTVRLLHAAGKLRSWQGHTCCASPTAAAAAADGGRLRTAVRSCRTYAAVGDGGAEDWDVVLPRPVVDAVRVVDGLTQPRNDLHRYTYSTRRISWLPGLSDAHQTARAALAACLYGKASRLCSDTGMIQASCCLATATARCASASTCGCVLHTHL